MVEKASAEDIQKLIQARQYAAAIVETTLQGALGLQLDKHYVCQELAAGALSNLFDVSADAGRAMTTELIEKFLAAYRQQGSAAPTPDSTEHGSNVVSIHREKIT